jgi:Domain of unknown function (DUF389)
LLTVAVRGGSYDLAMVHLRVVCAPDLAEAAYRVLRAVLISITTIPAAANVGVAAAYGDWSEMTGALLQLVVNLTCIVVAVVVTLLFQRRLYRRRRRLATA